MNYKKRVARAMTFLPLGFLFLAGCATPRFPIKIDPAFSQRGIRSIALLPAIDQRKDRSYEIDLNYEINTRARKSLEKKGYVVLETSPVVASNRSEASRLMDMDPAYLASLGPANADAVMAIYLQDTLRSYMIMSYVFKAEAIGTLVSKADQTEVWRDKGLGNAGQGGLISGLLQGLYRAEALDGCVYGMLATLPKAPANAIALTQTQTDA